MNPQIGHFVCDKTDVSQSEVGLLFDIRSNDVAYVLWLNRLSHKQKKCKYSELNIAKQPLWIDFAHIAEQFSYVTLIAESKR